MAFRSVCPKPECNSTSFELAEEEPRDSRYKLLFVRCSRCGAVVGTMDYYNIGHLLHKFAKELNIDLNK